MTFFYNLGDFVHDDIPAIVRNPDVTGSKGLRSSKQSSFLNGRAIKALPLPLSNLMDVGTFL